MNWKLYQRIFEMSAVLVMMIGVALMWKRSDPQHLLIYLGFSLLATGKLIEAMNLYDPNFRIIKMAACICIYVLVFLHIMYDIRSIVYVMIPLAIYYLLHYRLMFQQKRS